MSYIYKYARKSHSTQDLINAGITTKILSTEERPGEQVEIEFAAQPTPQEEAILDGFFSYFNSKEKRVLSTPKPNPVTTKQVKRIPES